MNSIRWAGWRAASAAAMLLWSAMACAQKAALIRDIDAPGRQPYFARCSGGGLLSCNTAVVAAGKRLTVTGITVRLVLNNANGAVQTPLQTAVPVDVYEGGNQLMSTLVPIPQVSTCTGCNQLYGGTLATWLFLDEGQRLFMNAINVAASGGGPIPSSELYVAGYLTDK